jgi:two-component sensor histidine kinase
MPSEGPDRLPPTPDGTRTRQRLQAVDALLLTAILLPVLLFVAVVFYDRSQTLDLAERDLLATLDTLHGHAEKVFQFQALALGATEARLRDQSDEEILADAGSHHAFLRALRRHTDEWLGIVVFGADGRPLVDSENPIAPRAINVSDRSYFRRHQENSGLGPYVAGLIRSRTDDEPVFFITTRRSAADGSFLGVITAGVRQSTFIEYWNRAAPAQNALISLTRDDGVILARNPPLDPDKGNQISRQAPLWQAMMSGTERAMMRGKSPLDGIDRFAAFRRLEHFPVNIAYGASREAVLSRLRLRILIYGGFTIVLSAALSSLALMAKRRTRELHEVNASLEQRVGERTAEIQASEARVRLLAQEVDHRAKNALAVVMATLRLTPKNDVATYAKAVEGRISALARVQTLLSEDRWRGASLHALLKAELAPFVWEGGGELGPRADLDGLPVLLPPVAAQPIAMAAHELATNALKHGALSIPVGRVTVSWRLTGTEHTPRDKLLLRWVETNGPKVANPPTRRGFGTRVLESIVRGQLGGKISLNWPDTGLVCEIEIPRAFLAKTPPPTDITYAA